MWSVENSLKDLLNHWWCYIMIVLLWIVQWCENGHFSIICVNKSFVLFWDMVVTSVMWIEKEQEIKEDVSFWVTYRAPRWILILMDVSGTAMTIIIEGHHILWWMNGHICLPWVPDWETICVYLRQTCITILDIAFHCIAHIYH